METETMGRVTVQAKIENLEDLYRLKQGTIGPDEVRSIKVDDALVDTGATYLCLPGRLIDQLGLKRIRTRRVRTAAGMTDSAICEAVRLTVQGRDLTVDVAEVSDDCPPLIGQIPLEGMDFVVDPVNRRLVGNPEHGGEHMIDIFSFR